MGFYISNILFKYSIDEWGIIIMADFARKTHTESLMTFEFAISFCKIVETESRFIKVLDVSLQLNFHLWDNKLYVPNYLTDHTHTFLLISIDKDAAQCPSATSSLC